MKNDKELLEKLSIEFAERYALATKTNYDVNLENDLYEVLRNYDSNNR